MEVKCTKCHALFWLAEQLKKSSARNPQFSICCANGTVVLPLSSKPPVELANLLESSDGPSKEFQKNIRGYNTALCFASLGASIDYSVQINGPYNFRIHGSMYHAISSLIPNINEKPKFAQIYFHDTDNELDNRHILQI